MPIKLDSFYEPLIMLQPEKALESIQKLLLHFAKSISNPIFHWAWKEVGVFKPVVDKALYNWDKKNDGKLSSFLRCIDNDLFSIHTQLYFLWKFPKSDNKKTLSAKACTI